MERGWEKVDCAWTHGIRTCREPQTAALPAANTQKQDKTCHPWAELQIQSSDIRWDQRAIFVSLRDRPQPLLPVWGHPWATFCTQMPPGRGFQDKIKENMEWGGKFPEETGLSFNELSFKIVSKYYFEVLHFPCMIEIDFFFYHWREIGPQKIEFSYKVTFLHLPDATINFNYIMQTLDRGIFYLHLVFPPNSGQLSCTWGHVYLNL